MILDHFWVDPGHFGVTLGSFWHRFGIILGLFWHRFELIFGPFGAFLTLLGDFWAFSGQKLVILGILGQKMYGDLKPYFEEDT